MVLSVIIRYLLVGGFACHYVNALEVSPAHREFLGILFGFGLMTGGNTDLAASAAGREGVDNKGTCATAAIVGETHYVYLPVIIEVDIVENEFKQSAVVGIFGEIVDISGFPYQVVKMQGSGLKLHRVGVVWDRGSHDCGVLRDLYGVVYDFDGKRDALGDVPAQNHRNDGIGDFLFYGTLDGACAVTGVGINIYCHPGDRFVE